MPRARKAAGCKASLKSHPCRCHALSPLPMRPVSRWKGGTRTAGQTAPGGLRVYLPTSLCSGDFTRMISEKQKTLTAFKLQGSQPITPEPAPSHRLWASAWARPLADAITLTCTRKQQPQKGTFFLCWKRGHFHFALTSADSFAARIAPSHSHKGERAIWPHRFNPCTDPHFLWFRPASECQGP